MSKLVNFGSLLAGALILSIAPIRVGASTHDKLTYLTFSAPVQIPGAKLDAGTYRFRVTNPDTSSNVLQVLSNNGSTVYAMFHTIPDSRTVVTDDSTVTFMETPAGVAPAVRSLFYGGERRGYEFVYPAGGPDLTVAIPAPQPAIAFTAAPAAPNPEPAAEAAPAPVPEPSAELAQTPTVRQATPVAPELPKTSSSLPLVGLTGFGALVLALGVRLLRERLI